MDQELGINENVGEIDTGDIFEEDTGLEEKQEPGENVPEKGVQLPLGTALNIEGLYQIASRKSIEFICIMGPVKSGKTTFQAMMYSMFLRSASHELLFSGSESIAGFEELLNYIRVASGKSEVDLPRTPMKNGETFYHLELFSCSRNEKKNFVFADVPGELFDICKANRETLDHQVPYLGMAKNVVIFMDGNAFLENASWNAAVMNTRTLLLAIKSSNQYKRKMNIDIVISKNDEIVQKCDNKKTAKNIRVLKEKLESLSEYFNIHIFRIQALNDYKQKDDSSDAIPDLLIHWMKEREPDRKQVNYRKNQLKVTSWFHKFVERQSYE